MTTIINIHQDSLMFMSDSLRFKQSVTQQTLSRQSQLNFFRFDSLLIDWCSCSTLKSSCKAHMTFSVVSLCVDSLVRDDTD